MTAVAVDNPTPKPLTILTESFMSLRNSDIRIGIDDYTVFPI